MKSHFCSFASIFIMGIDSSVTGQEKYCEPKIASSLFTIEHNNISHHSISLRKKQIQCLVEECNVRSDDCVGYGDPDPLPRFVKLLKK